MEQREIAKKLKTLPEKPGLYLFQDKRQRILYIGKARNLKKRLRTYFQKSSALDARKRAMLSRTADFSYIVTDTEREALALEANLIKEHKPRYNIVLRDDKNYPYLKLTLHERWPRLDVVRRIGKDDALYFGPFIPASSLWETLAFIRRHFAIRPCRYRLDRPMRPCVQYEMGRCPAPCADLISPGEYRQGVKEVERFLKGEKGELIEEIEQRMHRFSEELRYEEAAKMRDRLQALRRAFESQKVVSPELGDIDLIGLAQEGAETVFQVFFVRNGILISAQDYYLRDTASIPRNELFEHFIQSFYAREIIPPTEVVTAVKPSGLRGLSRWLTDRKGGPVRIKLADTDTKRELMAMASANASMLLHSRRGVVPHEVIAKLGERLDLRNTPESIGAFDVSTTYGSFSVGAFVWWEAGGFRKDRYRHLKIRAVPGIDDYAMTEEIVFRTLKHLKKSLPDLIVIDGGKGHLEVGLQAVAAVLGDAGADLDVVAVAKGPDRSVLRDGRVVPLDDGGADALLLKRIRDEAHRFAITFHRKLRGKAMLESRLEKIPGIGPKRRLALLKHFRSTDAIGRATVEQIAGVPGMNRQLAARLLAEL